MTGDLFIGGDDPFDIDATADAVEEFRTEAEATDEATRRFVERRKLAYVRLFNGEAQDGDAKLVMADLTRFCRGAVTTFHPDPRVHALLEGRREVWQRIVEHTQLDPSTLFRKYHQGE